MNCPNPSFGYGDTCWSPPSDLVLILSFMTRDTVPRSEQEIHITTKLIPDLLRREWELRDGSSGSIILADVVVGDAMACPSWPARVAVVVGVPPADLRLARGLAPPVPRVYLFLAFFPPRGAPFHQSEKTGRFPQKTGLSRKRRLKNANRGAGRHFRVRPCHGCAGLWL
jgi:hypothetical protein